MNYEVTRLNLENEMDLVLAHKRSIRLGEMLNLSLSSQTAFTTAISECCREVIEKTGSGLVIVQISKEDNKFFLTAGIRYKDAGPGTTKPSRYNPLEYARKLVSHFTIYKEDLLNHIELRINIPQSRRLTEEKIAEITDFFRNEHPSTPYEQVKRKKEELNRIASEQEEQLMRSRYVNEKKTEFLSIASHELKTPLTTIKAFTQLALAEGDACSETVKMYLNKINLQSDKLNKLIQQLLDISKVETGQLDLSMEEVSMNGYIHDTVNLLSKTIPTNPILMELKDNVVASVDKLRLEQVFSNILVNAAKYSSERTPIRITTAIEPGKLLRISIQDEGIGMSEQNMRRVFDKFFRAEEIARSYSGLGMGLYIASRIINTHGGRIWIDSKLDIGSTFHFTLPYLHISAPSLKS
jgi:signal transduction histidine kinase